MPGGNRRGPIGTGPRTGKGLGYCNGHDSAGFTKVVPGMGRGFKRGHGPGRGMKRGYNAGYAHRGHVPVYNQQTEYTKDNEIIDLKEYAKNMKRELEDVLDRIKELEEK